MWPEMSLVSEREGRKRLNSGGTSYRFVITSILFVILLLGIMGAQVPFVKAAEIHVPDDYLTIQEAVNHANPGDTIIVAAGTYDEQVAVNRSLTIQGEGDATIVKPSSASKLTTILSGQWGGATKQIAGIIVANVTLSGSVTIKNLKVDCTGVTSKPSGADYLAGIFYRETGGVIDSVNMLGGGAWSGGDRGYGIYLSAVANTVSVEVKGSTITNYDKNGIDAHGNKLTVNIHDNTITGRGPLPSGDEVQNGVVIMDGATGTVNHNTISNMAYQPEAWWSAGILFYEGSGSAQGNTITNCQIGVMYQDGGGTASGNTVDGGSVGILGLWAQGTKPGTWTIAFTGNTISKMRDSTLPGEGAGAGASTYDEGASLTVTIEDNQITAGISTGADGICIGDVPEYGPAGSITATIRNNVVSGWQHGVDLLSSVAGATITGNTIQDNIAVDSGIHVEAAVNVANVHVNFNNILENTNTGSYGVYNGGTGTLDAENNWWGSATGPTHPSNPGGTGDKVSDNVDFKPWLLAPTSGGKSGTVSGSGMVDAKTEAHTTVDISATGSHTITVASYTSNPGGALPLTALGKYIDVHIDSSAGVTEIVIKVYYTDDEVAAAGLDENTLMLFWWNGASWVACSDQGRDTVNNYIRARMTATTTPSLSQLVGTPFGAGGRAPAPPPAAKYLRVELHPSSVEVDVSSGPKSIRVTADASTSDGASAYITYMWSVSGGELNVEQGRFVEASTVEWTLTRVGDYSITCVARSQGYNDGEAVASVTAIPEIGSPLGIFYVALTAVYILLWGVRWRRGRRPGANLGKFT